MSRARRVKKDRRIFEWVTSYGTMSYIGYSAREARIDHLHSKRWSTGGFNADEPAHGVKYHVPRSSYVQYKGRKQLPRLYYRYKKNRKAML